MKFSEFAKVMAVVLVVTTLALALLVNKSQANKPPVPRPLYKVEQLNAAGDTLKEWTAVYISYNGGYLAAYTNSTGAGADIIISAPYRVTRYFK